LAKAHRLLVVALLWLAASPSGRVWAQPVGPEFQINGYTTDDQTFPDVAMDANGDFVVVWASRDQDGNGYGIRQRRYRSDGTPKSGGFPVNTYTLGAQASPDVASDANGNFVVVWMSQDQDGSSYGIFAQLYDATGAAQGGEIAVNGYTTSTQLGPSVAMDGSGNFVVVWQSYEQDGSLFGIRGRRFDAQGAPLGPGFAVNTYTTGQQNLPAIASTPSGSFVVVWSSEGQDGNDYGVFGQLYDASGGTVGGEFRVNGYTAGTQWFPDVAMAPGGGFVVAWESIGQDGDSGGVFARQFDDTGAPVGAAFAVNAHTTSDQDGPRLAMRPDGSFAAVWSSLNQPGGQGSDVVGRRFSASGAALGGEFRANASTTSHQFGGGVAMDPDGDFVVSWQGNGQDGDGYGIFGQRYGDLIFQDNFESDGVSRWSSSVTDGTDLDVTAASAMAGTGRGMRALVDDTTGLYVQDDSPEAEGRYRARFYFDPNGFDPGESAGKFRVRIFIAFNGSSQRMATIVLRRLGGVYSVMGRVRRDDGTRADTGFFAITDAPHFIEFDWLRAGGPGANNGSFALRIDDAAVSTLIGIDNDAADVEFARMGVMTIKTTAASGTMRYDQFESRRLNGIGPEQ
jgi:hypothetical protein